MPSTDDVRPADLEPTWYLDFEADAVQAFVGRAVDGATNEGERVRGVFAAVRDGVRYDPYALSTRPEDYRASAVAASDAGWCVPKAVLLVAACRALGIPARLGFADVRNHLQSERLLALMGTDLFRYHGYAAIHRGDGWVKASPAFNRQLCERFGVPPLDFDGERDALMHAHTGDGRRHMEYVCDHGTFDDLPLDRIMGVLRETYPAIIDDGLTGTQDSSSAA